MKSYYEYFIAIVPPNPTYAEALKVKEYFRDHHNSKASLNSPPHITLHMPFRWRAEKEEILIGQLTQFSIGVSSFSISLNGFASFAPRVIYINVVESPELIALQLDLKKFCRRNLNLLNADYREYAFRPHLTVAFRDLKKQAYEAAWKEFVHKPFLADFVVDTMMLLKHNGNSWEVHRSLAIGTRAEGSETMNASGV